MSQVLCPVFQKVSDKLSTLEKEICLYHHPYEPLPCEDKCSLPCSTRLYFRTAMRAANAAEYSRYQSNFRLGQEKLQAASKGGKKRSKNIQKEKEKLQKIADSSRRLNPTLSNTAIAKIICRKQSLQKNFSYQTIRKTIKKPL
jgi:hypothetical protein